MRLLYRISFEHDLTTPRYVNTYSLSRTGAVIDGALGLRLKPLILAQPRIFC